VRNTAGTIIEYEYGEDGIDPSRSFQGQPVPLDEILATVLGRRVRPAVDSKGEPLAGGAPPVGEEEMDLLAEAQAEEETEDEEAEDLATGEEGPDFGGE
jgi:DNA-directed RNA polymerase subunit A'